MDGISHTRNKRWNRRQSDGASLESLDNYIDPVGEDGFGDVRRNRWLRRIHDALGPMLGRDNVRMTEELRDRIAAATLASSATFITLSLLIFDGQGTKQEVVLFCVQVMYLSIMPFFFSLHPMMAQEYLPLAWIGNVIAITTLKSTLGDTFLSAMELFLQMVPVAACSWGIAYFLCVLSTEVYSFLLPFVVVLGCLVIFLCPFITSKNLILIIFYIIMAAPLSLRHSGFDGDSFQEDELGIYFAPGLVGTCTVGLSVALFVHILMIPMPRSTMASRLSQGLAKQLAYETRHLLSSVSKYTQNLGIASNTANQSRTLIDFYVLKRQQTLKRLVDFLPALRAEKYLTKSDLVGKIEAYVMCSKKQQKHAELISLATTQQFLGEDFTYLNDSVRDVKTKFSTNLSFAVEQLVLNYVRSEHSMFFGGSSESSDAHEKATFRHLESSMDSYRNAMKQATIDAETLLINDDSASRSATGPLIRQRVAFLGVFSFVHELCDMITKIGNEDDELSPTRVSQLVATLKMPWLWGDLGKRRLALKTALGLGVGSLWVSIPYLRGHVSYPNSIWVGVTVASVSLESTGATYLKCIDRLWGTLMAGGFAVSLMSTQLDHMFLLYTEHDQYLPSCNYLIEDSSRKGVRPYKWHGHSGIFDPIHLHCNLPYQSRSTVCQQIRSN
jgi:hypothetical protein